MLKSVARIFIDGGKTQANVKLLKKIGSMMHKWDGIPWLWLKVDCKLSLLLESELLVSFVDWFNPTLIL